MGLIYANIELRNPSRPDLQPLAVEALVDTGAVTLCIPQHVAVQLDLHEIEQREVTTADERSHVVPYVGPLQVGFHSRRCFTGALVIGETVLLGAIPMEDMDLVLSPSRQTITVNPKSPNLPSAVVKRLSASSLSPCEPRAGREPERGDTAFNSECPGNKGQGTSTANHFNSIPLTVIPLTPIPLTLGQTGSNPVKPDFTKRTHSDLGLRILDFGLRTSELVIGELPSATGKAHRPPSTVFPLAPRGPSGERAGERGDRFQLSTFNPHSECQWSARCLPPSALGLPPSGPETLD